MTEEWNSSDENDSILTSQSNGLDNDIFCLQLLVDKDSDDEDNRQSFQFKNYEIEKIVKNSEQLKCDLYVSDCRKYRLPSIRLVREAIMGKDCLDLKNYGVPSLHLYIIFDAFNRFPITSLRHLDLTGNNFDKFSCKALGDYIIINTILKTLILKKCKFGEKALESLTEGIMISTSIELLDLTSCDLNDKGGKLIADVLMRNETILEIILRDNNLRIESAKALGKALVNNNVLEKLDISCNSFPNENDVVDLLNRLIENVSIKEIDLSGNLISGVTFSQTLRKYLIRSKTLKVLNLSSNRLSSTEAKHLAIGLKKSKSMEKIFLEHNSFDKSDLINLVNVFSTNTTLQFMSFGKDFYVAAEVVSLISFLKERKPHVEIIYRGRLLPNPPKEVSLKDICADRAKYLAMKPKQQRAKRDFGRFMLKLKSSQTSHMPLVKFMEMLKKFNAKALDASLIDLYVKQFKEAAQTKNEAINVHAMADHYLARHSTEPRVKTVRRRRKRLRRIRKNI